MTALFECCGTNNHCGECEGCRCTCRCWDDDRYALLDAYALLDSADDEEGTTR